MRKIKLKTTMAGPEGCYYPSQVISVEDDLANTLVAGGYAEYADGGWEYETATFEPSEKAVSTRGKPRKAASS